MSASSVRSSWNLAVKYLSVAFIEGKSRGRTRSGQATRRTSTKGMKFKPDRPSMANEELIIDSESYSQRSSPDFTSLVDTGRLTI